MARDVLAEIRKDILAVPEIDGTWADDEQSGKPYGSAMALMILRMAKDLRGD